jgi:hypothetical protein
MISTLLPSVIPSSISVCFGVAVGEFVATILTYVFHLIDFTALDGTTMTPVTSEVVIVTVALIFE